MKQKIAFALMMGIVTTGIISFTLISINIGYTDLFFNIWLKSWSIAYLVVIPVILIIGPLVQALVNRLFAVETADEMQQEAIEADEEPEVLQVLTEMIEE